MNPLIVLCPGQGAQAVGMGKAWAEKSPEARGVFEAADRILGSRLGAPLSELCFNGPAERLNQTDVSQPAIYVSSVASWRGLLAKWSAGNGEVPLAATAGLSLGEYTALHVAGAVSFEDGLELVTLRGRAMQEACSNPDAARGGGSGMVALVGGDDAQAQAVCDQARGDEILVCANFNAPGQVVLSGHKNACARAAEIAAGTGLRATMLTVAGAFHSPLMSPAAEQLGAALAKTTIKTPRAVVVSNVTAVPHAEERGMTIADTIRRRLVEQLTSPVRWSQSCRWIADNVKGECHELAPGRTLMGLMRRIEKSVKVEAHDEP